MFHKVTIIGNLGRDPEMRYTPSGAAVTSFSVASNRKYTASDGEEVKETVWFRVTVWNKLAEIVSEYVKSGRQLYIEGRLTPDKETGGPKVWTRSDGTPGASYEITAQTVLFLGSRGETAPLNGGSEAVEAEAESIPF